MPIKRWKRKKNEREVNIQEKMMNKETNQNCIHDNTSMTLNHDFNVDRWTKSICECVWETREQFKLLLLLWLLLALKWLRLKTNYKNTIEKFLEQTNATPEKKEVNNFMTFHHPQKLTYDPERRFGWGICRYSNGNLFIKF